VELTEDQIRYGISHAKCSDPARRRVVEVAEHRGEPTLAINCTQLGGTFTPQFASAKEKKRILREWCDYLKANPGSFTSLAFGTRMPQELFDAVCHQRALVHLEIKWGAYEDLSALAKMRALRVLHIGSGARVGSLAPLTELTELMALSVENFQKITDYAPLTRLRKLQSLSIEGDILGPQHIKPDSLEFLREMPQLRAFRLIGARLQSKDYRPVLALQNLEHLTLTPRPEVKAVHAELAGLPKLQWGWVKEKPELFQS
jgi:hypothetical protein